MEKKSLEEKKMVEGRKIFKQTKKEMNRSCNKRHNGMSCEKSHDENKCP